MQRRRQAKEEGEGQEGQEGQGGQGGQEGQEEQFEKKRRRLRPVRTRVGLPEPVCLGGWALWRGYDSFVCWWGTSGGRAAAGHGGVIWTGRQALRGACAAV